MKSRTLIKIVFIMALAAMVGMNVQAQSYPGITNPITSVYPVIFETSYRQVSLEVKITAPVKGENLPVIIISHGHGAPWYLASYRGMSPLADYYASNGFVVIQPTHQDSRILGLDKNGPEGALFWKSRVQDMIFCIDHMDELLANIPGLAQRTDKDKIAAVGFSMGGHTISMLAGMQLHDPVSGKTVTNAEPRIKAFVSLGAPGNGTDIAEWAAENYPATTGTDYSTMTRDALIVVGDRDKNPQFSTRDSWRFDIYNTSPAPKTLLKLTDTGHMLGGIMGWDALETNATNDENPETLIFIQQMTTAYLRSKLIPNDKSWDNAISELAKAEKPKGKIEVKAK